MYAHLLSSSKSVTQAVHFLCLWIAIVISACYGQHGEQFLVCSGKRFSCGEVQSLTYPFWGGDRPQFCGHQDFNLTCYDNKYPTINIDNSPFRIHNVSQVSHTMNLSRFDLQDDFCKVQEPKNATFDGVLFQYGSDVKPLYLYYECSPVIPPEFFNFSCEFEGRVRTGFYTDSLWGSGYGRNQCHTGIEVWVTLAGLTGIASGSLDLKEGLSRGFEVNYNAHNSNCTRCEGSGGICGSDLTGSEFVCIEPAFRSSRMKVMIGALGASAAAGFFLTVILICWLTKKRKEKRRRAKSLFSPNISRTNQTSLIQMQFDESETSADLPFIHLSTLVEATDSFSINNKLGQGGFGSVYKGTLKSGQEIAVKRLSKSSGQGAEEFKNEATLIAKLQHRNLVRLLGYCVQREEKILIYEYLPNNSLDSLIFDSKRGSCLEWGQRFSIIMGITRGMVYLHHDSRLKIIHRDLKASNVLLDAEMNPKISDFGMARIFGGNQIQANTNRVVGTYGYMSPEYAMEGLFSTKSDVFSFGVLLLEMISGRKNSSFYQEISLNLIGHVWDLWREGRALEMVDPSLGDSYSAEEVLRCIHVGLLSVQEQAIDRPTMSEVAFMLSNETALPPPKQPAFIINKFTGQYSSPASVGAPSSNCITLSVIEAR